MSTKKFTFNKQLLEEIFNNPEKLEEPANSKIKD